MWNREVCSRATRTLLIAAIGLSLLASACNGTTTTPSDTSEDEEDDAEVVTTTESWEGIVPVGGSTFYSFSVGVSGTVNVTLLSAGGQFVPTTVMLGVAVGTPDGTGCSITSHTTAQAGTAAQVTGTFNPGVHCVNVADIGNLFAPATVAVTVEHP